MNTKLCLARLLAALALLLPVFTSFAHGSPAVPDPRLLGQWQGQNRFGGLSRAEIVGRKVAVQYVPTRLNITADGRVSGHVGGAELRDCAVTKNRGCLGRLLHLKTDFIITGKISGSVVPGSADGIHWIDAPFNLRGPQIDGTVFNVRGAFLCPYPFLQLRLNREGMARCAVRPVPSFCTLIKRRERSVGRRNATSAFRPPPHG